MGSATVPDVCVLLSFLGNGEDLPDHCAQSAPRKVGLPGVTGTNISTITGRSVATVDWTTAGVGGTIPSEAVGLDHRAESGVRPSAAGVSGCGGANTGGVG